MASRRLVRRIVALPVRPLRRARSRRALERLRRIETEVFAETAGRVADGPFKGMEFVEHAVWGSASPTLAGCYEAEIQSAVETLIASQPDRVVDVGAAEGYYAVGLALRLPGSMVYAYDIDPEARRVCSDVARRNRVEDRVVVRGYCTHEGLAELTGPGCAIVVDCEGCEKVLLDPVLVPSLASTLILVELHDFLDPSISSVVEDRFASTHHITVYRSTERNPATVPAVAALPAVDRQQAVSEMRPIHPHPMEWMLLTPQARG